ncbi:DDB1- and CUL4-associated factor 13 [Diplonema papillatum]|nr:DDB1- and CUL4-associated factor 13 [Diplonema papillatum]
MKIKCLSRTSRDHTKDRGSDVSRVHRNLDPKLHPFDRQIEYKRAVTAAKLDRMFAKPFVAAFDGHIDTVCALAKDPSTRQANFHSNTPIALTCSKRTHF